MRPTDLTKLLKKMIAAGLPALISGKSGIGKTALVQQIANKLGRELVVSHPVVSDPIDFKGMPCIHDGEANFLPFGTLRDLMNTGTPTIWLIDDIGQAPLAVQAALMQLLHQDSRGIEGFQLSEHVSIVACTNRKQDKAGVGGFLEPMKSRFVTILELEANLDDWTAWACESGIDPKVTAFLHFRPALLSAFRPSMSLDQSPSPRAWKHVSQLVDLGLPLDLLHEAVIGTVGEAAAREFAAFLATYESLPDVLDIAANPEYVAVPPESEPATRFAVTSALSHFADEQTITPFAQYMDRMPSEFETLFFKLATVRDEKLCDTAAYTTWAASN